MKEQTSKNKPAAVAGAGKARLFPKQAGETPDRWSWVERSVWTEHMLKRLAESQEQTVWFSLWDKVWNSDNLVAFLALSVNFFRLVSGWTGEARGAVEWQSHRLKPWRFLRSGVRRLLRMEPVKF